MKQKNNSSQTTKGYLRKEFLASEKRLEKKFVIRDYLDKRFDSFAKAFRDELRFSMDQFVQQVNDMLTQFTNRILTTVDPLLRELETRQQDRAIAAEQMSQVRQELKEHDRRIVKLEHPHAT